MTSLRCLASVIILCSSYLISAAELPVPDELIGKHTVIVANIDVANIDKDQLSKCLTTALGNSFDPKSLDQFSDFRDKFKAAGGTSLNIVFNMQKNATAENADKGMVLVVGKSENVKGANLAQFFNALNPKFQENMAPDCPEVIGDSLVWYQKGFKLPKADEDQAQLFSDAFDQIDEKQSISVVVMPDEDAMKTADASMKPNEAELLNALCDGGGICISSDFGMVENPALRVLVLAPDAKGAATLKKAADDLLAAIKTDVPPQAKVLLDNLEVVKAGTNVQISLGFANIAKSIKEIVAGMVQAPPAAK